MSKDLTNSPTERQNILNNNFALVEVEKAVGIRGIPFEGGTVVLKEQVAAFLEVTPRTIDNYLERFATELGRNGYEVIRGKRLQDLKLRISQSDVHETDFMNIGKFPQLGVRGCVANRWNNLRYSNVFKQAAREDDSEVTS